MTKKQVDAALNGFAESMMEAGGALAETRRLCREWFSPPKKVKI